MRKQFSALIVVGLGAVLSVAPPADAGGHASTLDHKFGSGGIVQTDFAANSDIARSVVEQPDGKLVVAGITTNLVNQVANSDFGLIRYNPNGSLDSTFGSGGTVVTDFANGSLDEVFGVALQADGKIVAAGRSNANLALARYMPGGSLDPTFGTGGLVVTDLGSTEVIRAMVIQPDGKIVVAGATGADFALARYDSSGALDPGFGTGGIVTTDIGGGSTDLARGLVLQADGKIVAVGRTQLGTVVQFAIARYNADGSLDPSYGTGGKVTTNLNGGAFDAVVQPDGRMIVVGAAGQSAVDFAVVRYNCDGSLDTGFGTGGVVTTDFGTTLDEGFAVALDSESRIIVAGHATSDFALARYNHQGKLTPGFGIGGKLITDVTPGGDDEARDVIVQSDGKIVTVGRNGAADFTAIRYLGDA